jgi:hypothetical protein
MLTAFYAKTHTQREVNDQINRSRVSENKKRCNRSTSGTARQQTYLVVGNHVVVKQFNLAHASGRGHACVVVEKSQP